MPMLSELLQKLPDDGGFNPIEVIGPIDRAIIGVRSPERAKSQHMAFYAKQATGDTWAGCIIHPYMPYPKEWDRTQTVLLTDNPKLLFAYMAQDFIPRGLVSNLVLRHHYHYDNYYSEIGDNATIEPGSVIQNAIIGNNVWIGPNVSIGGQGFGHVVDPANGRVLKFPQVGRVIIGDNVEICANSAIARGALGDTIIGDDVRMDQFVHIAHNCEIGKGTLIMAHAMIAGSIKVGRYCWIAPGTNVINKVTIGDFAMTGIGATVTGDVESNALVVGIPARKIRDRFEPDDPMLRL